MVCILSLHEIKASDIMKEPITIDSNASLEEAILKLINTGVGSLIVVENNKLVGIVTKRDIIWSIMYGGKNIVNTKVSEVMTKQLITVKPDTSLHDIVDIMLNNNISHLPVVDNDELIGIISDRDLVELLSEAIDVIKWYKEKIPEASE